uniref:mechanosensitive ion channel family protein n=1 Tax=Ningiella ruwaisensis TaxID=2364274 RepID=UPI00109F4BA5|nr:mechanosensitive ion channel domain-containing protein [Ningiella ruwaisensis]
MDINAWTQSFTDALSKFWTEIAGFLPNLIATIIVVLIGLYLSKVITKWVAKLVERIGFNKLCNKLGIEKALKALGFKSTPSQLVGSVLHIFFVLIILVAASETLGLQRISAVLDDFVLYLPKIVGALAIALIGLYLASKAKVQVENSLENLGVDYGSSVGRLLQFFVLFITFSLVVGQLNLETELLNTIFTVLIASFGVAMALALGLGSKEVANSIVSGIYAREQILPGDEVTIDDFVGNVVMVSTVNTLLEDKDGKQLSIPNQELLTKQFTIVRLGSKS